MKKEVLVMNSDHCRAGSEKVVPTSRTNLNVIPGDSGMFMVVHRALFREGRTPITFRKERSLRILP